MTDMTQAQDLPPPVLAPCPFCGSSELSHGFEWPPEKGSVQCHACDAFVVADTEAEAIAAWNRRPFPKAEMQRGEMAKALKAARRIVKMAEKAEKDGLVINGRVVARHYSDIAAESCLAISRALLSAPKDASRDDVLEEAAKVCEAISADWTAYCSYDKADAAEYLTAQIRALKEKPHG